MLTPRFSLSQDEQTLTIKVRAPYCCLRELEVEVEKDTFLFLCKPYYLRLNLPGNILENSNTKSSFDSDTGEFTFSYEKETCGEDFKDLEFITKFLVNKIDATYTEGDRKITVLASEGDTNKELIKNVDVSQGFGFALQINPNTFTMCSEFNDVFEVDPTEVNLKERRKLRLQYEQGKFDMGHYIGDFIEDQDIVELLKQTTPWSNLIASEITFTGKELDFLKDLPNIEYNLTELQIKYLLNSLTDILFAYCYDKRCTNFEGNSESGWTIVKLAASLCWLDTFETPKEALISAFRRSVIYPLYRNYQLSTVVLQDLKGLMKLGEQYIIMSLIEIYYIFLGGDCCRYVLNNLFIKDYIIYIMKWDKETWKKYFDDLVNIDVKKEELGLNLSEIEQGFSLDEKLAKLNVKDSDSDDCSSEDDSEDSSDDSDTDSSGSSDTDSDFAKSKGIFKFLC